MRNNVFLVTGITGTGVENSLKKVARESQRRQAGTTVKRVVSLEKDYLQPKAKDYVERIGLPGNHIMSVLTLPQPLLRALWASSFDEAMNTWATGETEDTVLVMFHSSYYHLQNKHFVSIVDFDMILKWKELIAGIINLVDDVFDCQQRLCSVRGRRLLDPPKDLEESLLQLLLILHWRQQETLMSNAIAHASRKELVVYAVKQRIDNFLRMVEQDAPRVYISHPISEVRRAYLGGETSAVGAFTEEYARHVEMLERRKFVVFEPTTIDDYRFTTGATLGRRWPLAGDIPAEAQLLWTKPARCRSDYIFPAGWAEDERNLKENAQPLVAYLSDIIDRHTTARDYQLIDQSDLVYAFRPLLYGHASGGVRKELTYAYARSQLGLGEGSRPFAVIYSPAKDRRDYPFRGFWDRAISKWATDQRIKGEKAQVEQLQKSLRDDEDHIRRLTEARDEAGFTDYLIEKIQECYLTFSAEDQSSRPMMEDKQEIRRAEALKCVREVLQLQSEQPYIEGFGLPIYLTLEEAENPVAGFCQSIGSTGE